MTLQPYRASKHETYYFPDGNIVLLLNATPCTLYRLHQSLLQRRSTFFQDFLPNIEQQDGEGRTDEHPICLPQFATRVEWDTIFCFLLDGVGRFEATIESITAVLKMSRYLDINDGVAYSVTTINQRPDFNSFLKLHLGITYHIDMWVKESFINVLRIPIRTFTLHDANLVGNFCLLEITQTQARIEEWRLRLSYDTPRFLNHPDCPHPCQCAHAWDHAWWNGLARHVLHPEKPMSSNDIIRELDVVKIARMCDRCQESAVSNVKDEGVLMLGDGYASEAVDRVWSWYSDKLDRAMMMEVRNS